MNLDFAIDNIMLSDCSLNPKETEEPAWVKAQEEKGGFDHKKTVYDTNKYGSYYRGLSFEAEGGGRKAFYYAITCNSRRFFINSYMKWLTIDIHGFDQLRFNFPRDRKK